jgi:hypothetical protein
VWDRQAIKKTDKKNVVTKKDAGFPMIVIRINKRPVIGAKIGKKAECSGTFLVVG